MLPLGHLALAYLMYVLYAAVTDRRLPARPALLPLAFGSQFPDLVDKPLAYYGVLTYGRSLAHSAFTFALVGAAVWCCYRGLAWRWSGIEKDWYLRVPAPAPFLIGYGSHLLGDSYQAILSGNFWNVRFLLYPLFTLPEGSGADIPPWTRLFRIYREMETHPQLELLVVAALVFVAMRVGDRVAQRR